ncbi:hypothetical protein [Tenacibaculum finnmarkense]|uniref:hypothetical protein n=1 Tax=Tenacibaculum finnmarkense TaxID=2781243 RepID=UPI001E2FEBAD|nr:hypothetical protein [Tenacibaculum finnmarkense]MCD8410673.1 hypothetical protein [Tenacibaculum finnmarkense genomovar ulcerans]
MFLIIWFLPWIIGGVATALAGAALYSIYIGLIRVETLKKQSIKEKLNRSIQKKIDEGNYNKVDLNSYYDQDNHSAFVTKEEGEYYAGYVDADNNYSNIHKIECDYIETEIHEVIHDEKKILYV